MWLLIRMLRLGISGLRLRLSPMQTTVVRGHLLLSSSYITNLMKRLFLIVAYLSVCQLLCAKPKPLRLWYDRPAQVWEEMLPLGNGRLGMMPDGGINHEKIILNEITLWSGSEQDPNNYEAHKHVTSIQQLLIEGRNSEAERLVNQYFVCAGKGSGQGAGANVPYGCFQMLGTLDIRYHHAQAEARNYQRQLDLSGAIASTSFRKAGVRYNREYFTSFDGDVGIIRITADKKGAIDISVSLEREENGLLNIAKDELQLVGALPDGRGGTGMRYIARVRIHQKGGKLVAEKG